MAVIRRLGTDCGIEIAETKGALWPELGAGLEWLALRGSSVYRGDGVPHGDGEPVITVPGFLSSDVSMLELRQWLGRLGYAPNASNVGVNADCPDIIIGKLLETVEAVAKQSGARVRLIGYSLGGTLSRAAAVLRPDLFSQVITLGSPVRHVGAHPLVVAAARLLDAVRPSPSERSSRHGDRSHGTTCFCEFTSALAQPFPRGVTRASIYSRRDGVVNWRTCRDEAPGLNVEVQASHLGMVVNKDAYRAVANLLAEHPQAVLEAA